MATQLIGQVGFGSLMMLTWTAAALIPIALHLLRRRTRTMVPWAAMRLLQQVILQESRRSALHQMLLLLTRVAIMLLLALALARPFGLDDRSVNSGPLNRPNRLQIILIDTSYSMGYRTDQRSRLDLAKRRVAELVRESQLGDAFALVTMDRPAQLVIGQPTFDPQALLSEVDRLSETALDCDVEGSLSLAGDIVTDVRNRDGYPELIETIILTDLGVDGWAPAVNGSAAQQLSRLDEMTSVTVESFAAEDPVNKAVTSVTPSSRRAIVGQPLTFTVRLASVGNAVEKFPVRLDVDGQTVDSQEVEIEADGTLEVQLRAVVRSPGKRVFSVVIPSDNLPIDNRWDMVIEARSETRILIVDPETVGLNAWKLAIRPVEPPAAAPGAGSVRVVNESQWLTVRLEDWDVVIWNDPNLNNAGQLNRLVDYARNGDAVILALGPRAASEPAGRGLEIFERLAGLQLVDSSDWGDWPLDPLSYSSPVIAIFEGYPNAGLLTTPIFRYWRAEVVDPEVIIDLAFTTGDPMLTRRAVGKGSMACLMSAPQDGRTVDGDRSWNAMTTWPSFLPLVQQLVQTVLETDSDQRNRIAGEILSGVVEGGASSQSLVLVRPDQTEISLVPETPDMRGTSVWTYRQTDQRGIYRLKGASDQDQVFAVNIQPKQSRLQSLDPNQLNFLSGNGSTAEQLVPNGAERANLPPTDRIARILLICLGLLLFGESLLACFIGRRIG
jgi:hypothetical protein